jgi:hypothetical protein
VNTAAVELYCDKDSCQDVMFFDPTETDTPRHGEPSYKVLQYVCRHCLETKKAICIFIAS